MWSSAKIDYVDSDLNLFDYQGTMQKSWFTNNQINQLNNSSLKTFLLFYKYLLVDGMEVENTKIQRCLKLRLKKPLRNQQILLHKWASHDRFLYNTSLASIIDTNDCVKDYITINNNKDFIRIKLDNQLSESKNNDSFYYEESLYIKNILIDTFEKYIKSFEIVTEDNDIKETIRLYSRETFKNFFKYIEEYERITDISIKQVKKSINQYNKENILKYEKNILNMKESFTNYLKFFKIQETVKDIVLNKYEKVDILKFEYMNWYKKEQPLLHSYNKSKRTLRNDIFEICNNEWLKETPYAIKEFGVFEAHKNYTNAMDNFFKGYTKYPTFKYRTKKSNRWSIKIRKEAIKIIGKKVIIYPSFNLGELNLTKNYTKVDENNRPLQDCLLSFDGLYYNLCIPEKRIQKNDNNRHLIVSSDPGVRKFHTVYIPEKQEYVSIGTDASNILLNKLLFLDKLISIYSEKKTKRLKNQIRLLRKKIQNLQSELHNKTALWLCKNFKTIIIPKLNKKNDMISLKDRKLRTSTVRKMVVLGHNKFIQKLKTKAEEYSSKVEIVTEEYTSQKCSNCNKCTRMSDEIYKCKKCNYTCDRDVQGSKNILMKSLIETFCKRSFRLF